MSNEALSQPRIPKLEAPLSAESRRKGQEVHDHLEECLSDIAQLLDENPGVEVDKIRIVIDKSLDLIVIPGAEINYEKKHLARSSKDPIKEKTEEPFIMALSTAIPLWEDDKLRLKMVGNSKVSDDGFLNFYTFNPLEGHTFGVRRERQASETPVYKSGVALRREVGGSLFFTIY